MNSDIGLLKISSVILHDIPRHARGDDGPGPSLSEIASPMDQNLAIYFRDRTIDSLKSAKGFDITFDPSTASPVPSLIRNYLAAPSEDEFVSVSQEMAKHLYSIQDGLNPAGVLAVMDCFVATIRSLGILKLEREEGVRLVQQIVDAKRTFDISHLRDLILTKKTRVFKIALFVPADDKLEVVEGAASDHQTGYTVQTEVAGFFLRKFLGCKLLEDPQVSTKRFYEASEKFFNENVKNPIDRTRYYNHLVSELTSERPTISPEHFAQTYLATHDRQKYLSSLESQGVAMPSFPRNTELIDKKLQKQLIEFRSGISIVAPNDLDPKYLKLTDMPNGEVKAEIRDFLKSVRGKS